MSKPQILAAAAAVATACVLVALAFLGSRGFRDFDAALIGYFVGAVFAGSALVFRYTLWVSRPPTWRYFRAGWRNFLSWRNFTRYSSFIPKALWHDIFAQSFILKRSPLRWVMHMAIFWGVILSLAITLPLTFGWLHFTLATPDTYQLWVFGVPLFRFAIAGPTGFAVFHGLDWAAGLLIVGLAIAFWRRTRDVGLLTVQRFGFDLVPLVLLLAIAVTGLALTASSTWWHGRDYWFISLVHEVVVVGWLLSIPFGKFFHIVQRPATIGVKLYQTVNQELEEYGAAGNPGKCRRCEEALPSRQFISDLEATLADLEMNYDLGEGRGWLQDYCPTCKRVMRAEAYYQTTKRRFV